MDVGTAARHCTAKLHEAGGSSPETEPIRMPNQMIVRHPVVEVAATEVVTVVVDTVEAEIETEKPPPRG